MKILIIGGTKFVGFHLVWELFKYNHQLTLLNRGKTKADLPDGLHRIYADRKNHQDIIDELTDKKFDVIFDITGYYPDDVKAVIQGIQHRTRHYIFCSTASVYRSSEIFPIKENFPKFNDKYPEDPLYSDYGYNKYLCESVLLQQQHFPVTIIRPMYIYGPNNPIYRELYFFDRITQDRPILIPGKCKTITQFGHVDDLATAFRLTMLNKKAYGKSYNVTGSEYVTLPGLTETIAKSIDKNVVIKQFTSKLLKTIDLDASDIQRFPFDWKNNLFVDISKAKRDLDWEPEYTLLDGMKHTFQWIQNNDLLQTKNNFKLDNAILNTIKQ